MKSAAVQVVFDRLHHDAFYRSELPTISGSRPVTANEEQQAFEYIIKMLAAPGDKFETRVEFPKLPANTIGFIVPHTYLHINAKKSSLVTAMAVLDYVMAGGFLSAFLAMSGMSTKSFSRLEPTTGEFCVASQSAAVSGSGQIVTPDAVLQRISEKPCPFPQTECRHLRLDTLCVIGRTSVEELLSRLTTKEVLVTIAGGYTVAR